MFDDCFDSARREIPLRPTIDEFFFAPPPQWQCWFSPRPLGGPLSTETARASRRLSAHEYGRTARRRLSRAQGRSSIPKLAETRTLWVGSRQDGGRRRRLGGQRTHGEGRAGYHTGPRPTRWWPRQPARVGMLGSSRIRPPYHLRCPGSLRRGWGGSSAAWPLRPMWGARISAAAVWFQPHFSVLVWGANLFFWVCGRCSLQACSSSFGLAGTARARPDAFAQFVERALASPPLCCSSISAC